MAKEIWKFPVKVKDVQGVEMPEGAEILTVQLQHGQGCIWAVVDPGAEKVWRYFTTYGTGHPIINGADTYIGTYQESSGYLVWHVFEIIKPLK